jgi:hypothetical protein
MENTFSHFTQGKSYDLRERTETIVLADIRTTSRGRIFDYSTLMLRAQQKYVSLHYECQNYSHAGSANGISKSSEIPLSTGGKLPLPPKVTVSRIFLNGRLLLFKMLISGQICILYGVMHYT